MNGYSRCACFVVWKARQIERPYGDRLGWTWDSRCQFWCQLVLDSGALSVPDGALDDIA